MARRCPHCGTENTLEAETCEKCGFSFEAQVGNEIKALEDIKVFSMFLLIFSILSTLEFVANFLGIGGFSTSGIFSYFSGLNSQNLSSQLNLLFIVLEVVIVIGLLMETISIIYLRSGYNKIVRDNFPFSTPSTGASILIVGLVLAMVGVVLVIALIAPVLVSLGPGTHTIPGSVAGGILLGGAFAAFGGLLVFVGYILAVLLGLHRLSTKFEQPYFEWAWVLIIVSLFFSPIGLIAAFLVYFGTTKTLDTLKFRKNTNDAGGWKLP